MNVFYHGKSLSVSLNASMETMTCGVRFYVQLSFRGVNSVMRLRITAVAAQRLTLA